MAKRRKLKRQIAVLRRRVRALKTALKAELAPNLTCMSRSCGKLFKQWRQGPFENVCKDCWQRLLKPEVSNG